MIKFYSPILVFVSLTAFSSLSAQSSQYNWGLGVHPSTFSFYALDKGFFKGSEYEPGVQFSAMRYLNSSFDAGLEIASGNVRHPALKADFENGLRRLHRDNFYQGDLVARYKFDNGYILKKDAIISPFLKAGLGGNSYLNLQNWSAYAPLGAGVQIRLGKIAASIIAQSTYNLGLGSESYLQHSVGLNLNFGHRKIDDGFSNKKIADRDYDGIADEVDVCPDAFGTGRTKGCPDADNDGIKDTDDRCPDQAGYTNLFGCLDSDYDNIIDSEDECPSVYGTQANGCPLPKEQDTDGDNVPDSRDECPTVRGFFTAKGCPDADGDGIKDAADTCPDEYGAANYNGCPFKPELMKSWREGTLVFDAKGNPIEGGTSGYTNNSGGNTSGTDLEEYCRRMAATDLGKAYFNVDISQPQRNSFATMANIVEVMKRCINYSLTIKGHADADGSDNYNLRLSKRRADAVRGYLSQNGVDANRLRTEAFGESTPIAPNDTPSNKKLNRRTEFQMEAGSTAKPDGAVQPATVQPATTETVKSLDTKEAKKKKVKRSLDVKE